MLAGTSGLSKYIETLLNSEFPQADLMTPEQFIQFLKTMKIRLSQQRLEFYDEKGVLRPVLRYREPVLKGPNTMRVISGPVLLEMQSNREKVDFPKDADYESWSNYQTGEHERIMIYYHPYQFIQAHRLDGELDKVLGPSFLSNTSEIKQEDLESWKKDLASEVDGWENAMVETWIPLIGLLMLLESPYSVNVGRPISSSPHDPDYFERFAEWRMFKFIPRSILDAGGFTAEDVKNAYGRVARLGDLEDPLAQWYVLIELTKRSQKQHLRGPALLSQKYYELAKMTQSFAKNLGVQLLDPDDYCDGDGGSWKPVVYGEPFDYRSSRTQVRIRDRFFEDRPYRIALIYEGPSEERAIRMIFDALYIDDRRDGILLYNAKGQSNMEANLEVLFDVTKKSDIDVFEIVDGEKASIEMLNAHKGRGIIKEGMSHAWRKDFEYDNFGTANVVMKVAQFLQEKVSAGTLTIEEVEKKMEDGSVLMNAISSVTNSKYGIKIHEIVGKPRLVEVLIQDRVAQIREERDKTEWTPQLEIEKVLQRVFHLIPTNS